MQGAVARPQVQERVNAFVSSVYNWMAVGLAVTGVVAYVTANSSLRGVFVTNPMVSIVLFIVTLGLVFYLSARIQHMSANRATGLFVFYSGLMGLMLSSIFIVYTRSSIASTFFVSAATFVAASIYGHTTKRDLTGLGSFLFMGLIGIILASVVNMFVASTTLHWALTYIGVFVFIGLTAYDSQKVRSMAETQPADASAGILRKGAIIMALELYLDFINLFLFLLRIFGGARD